MPRRCIFCQQPASARGKGEHLFPDWLNTVFPVTDEDPVPEWERHLGAVGEEKTVKAWKAAEIAGETTKFVCNQCNTSWMADLESAAKPVLEPLIRGYTARLGTPEQLLAATWAVKTAMVIETTMPSEGHFAPAECEIVRDQRRPPASTSVYLAAIEGPIPPVQARCARVAVSQAEIRVFDLHLHTLQVGTLVLQVIRQEPPPADFGRLEGLDLPPELQPEVGTVFRVWPATGRPSWPPPTVLDWERFNTLSQRGIAMPMEWVPPPSPPPET